MIALLAIIGVDLIIIIVLGALGLSRKRRVRRQQGAFRGAIRVADWKVDGLKRKWRRGYGRWTRDVLMWTKAPFLFWNELVPIDGIEEQRAAPRGRPSGWVSSPCWYG